MRISIALATYNGERFVGEQLASLARQTLPPHELVVCDDGSTDRTVEVVEDFARAAPFPVVIQQNEANLGFTLNFMQAAARCTGDVVAFCDQDDVWLPHKLQRCAATLRDPEVLLVVHSGEVIDETGRSLGRRLPAIRECGKRSGREAPPFVAGRELASPPGFAMVLRKSVFDELQAAWPEELYQLLREQHANVSAHDTLLFFVAKDRGHIYYDDCSLVQFRAHSSNSTIPRRAFDAAPARARHGLAQALRANARDYARIAERDRAEAILLSAVHERGGFPSLGRLASTLFTSARAFGLRAALYRKRGLQYWKLYVWMLRHGWYGPRREGGLGLRSAAKEFALGCVAAPWRTGRGAGLTMSRRTAGLAALPDASERLAAPGAQSGGRE